MRITNGERAETRDERIVRVVREHAPELLRFARRLSLSREDAQDAYQRTLEIYTRRVDMLDPATERGWLFTVLKHEALAVRAARLQRPDVGGIDPDEFPAVQPGPDERAAEDERLERAAEALRHVKRDEATALILQANGLSYAEIAERMVWTRTMVDRCLLEGRRRFLRAYAEIEAGEECSRLAPVIAAMAEGSADADQLALARPHLRGCLACRARVRELHAAPAAIAAVFPIGILRSADAVEAGSSALTRAYEAMTLAAHKLQGTLELLVSGKAALAVASAAAVAGGGAMAIEHAASPPPAPQVGRLGLEHGGRASGGNVRVPALPRRERSAQRTAAGADRRRAAHRQAEPRAVRAAAAGGRRADRARTHRAAAAARARRRFPAARWRRGDGVRARARRRCATRVRSHDGAIARRSDRGRVRGPLAASAAAVRRPPGAAGGRRSRPRAAARSVAGRRDRRRRW